MSHPLLMLAAAAIGGGSSSVSLDLVDGDSWTSTLFTPSSGTATAGIRVLNNGDMARRSLLTPFTFVAYAGGNWWRSTVAGIGDNYEVRLTVNSGTSPTTGPALNTWHALTADRTWDLEVTGPAGTTATGNWRLEIKNSATGSAVAATADFDITALVDSI